MTITSSILFRVLGLLRNACILLATYWLLWFFYETGRSGQYAKFCQGQFFLALVAVVGMEVLRQFLRKSDQGIS